MAEHLVKMADTEGRTGLATLVAHFWQLPLELDIRISHGDVFTLYLPPEDKSHATYHLSCHWHAEIMNSFSCSVLAKKKAFSLPEIEHHVVEEESSLYLGKF